jgi:hypothetical protein
MLVQLMNKFSLQNNFFGHGTWSQVRAERWCAKSHRSIFDSSLLLMSTANLQKIHLWSTVCC